MSSSEPVTFTLRPRRRPICPLCSDPLVDPAWRLIGRIAFCDDCASYDHVGCQAAAFLLNLDLVANALTTCNGAFFFTPAQVMPQDVWSYFEDRLDVQSLKRHVCPSCSRPHVGD